ncbi:MAG: hypothetical protein CL764_06810 [Chloroflexi bacterium]|nr:hypothetical protein [Chloroflexota bacterium]|tara:strand:- start:3302 stop:3763 length:462 start_codon:yes stop_codon:yes gene_type:complete
MTKFLMNFIGKRFQSRPYLIVSFGKIHKWLYLISSGKIFGNLGNLPVLILNTKGRTTGRIIKTVLVYFSDQGKIFIIASFGGNPKNPSWFLNIQKNPYISIQIKNEKINCFARILSKEEKDLIWPKIILFYSGYERYQNSTSREIPVIELESR